MTGRFPDGIEKLDLKEGLFPGKSKIAVKGKGLDGIPSLAGVTAPLNVQLMRAEGPCWGSVFSGPFLKHDAGQLKDKSD